MTDPMWRRPWLSGLRGWTPATGGIGTPSPHAGGLGSAVEDAHRLYTPPTPQLPGPWSPTETEINEWGSSKQVTLNPGPPATPVSGESVGLLHASFPVPLPIVVSFNAEPIDGSVWSNAGPAVMFDVTYGVGRGRQRFSTFIVRPASTPVSQFSLGFLGVSQQIAARTIQIEARMVGEVLAPEAALASCSIAYIL